MFKRKFKLKYTKEMKKQDELWKTCEESPVLMKKLRKEVAEEAKKKGFTGTVTTYLLDNVSCLSDIIIPSCCKESYGDKIEWYERDGDKHISERSYGTNIGLIQELTRLMNK
ncbi:single-stranded DNA-specific DHH superfamily exonuclease [Lachnospiraceae bacterium PF1-22]